MGLTRLHPEPLNGLSELLEHYDAFIIDQFGVLHDGQTPYKGAVETLEALKSAGKKTLLLSNSGKRSQPNESRLHALGFPMNSWDHLLTSGELAWRTMSAATDLPKHCLLISRDNDRSAIKGLPIEPVEDATAAGLVLITASEADRYDLEYYRKLLKPAAERGALCLCTNPDQVMLTVVGPRFGAGRIADLYRELGGSVKMIGKPHPEIYTAALNLLGDPDPARVLCIGDSVAHDIVGGLAAGCKTALVDTGIPKPTELEDLYTRNQAVPNYRLKYLAF